MFKHRTKAALAVLSFPGEDLHGDIFGAQGGGGVGFPQVRWRFADQYGMIGIGSGAVATEPFALPSSSELPARPLSALVCADDGSDGVVKKCLLPRSVSVSEPVLCL
jgi:hypothetical protein